MNTASACILILCSIALAFIGYGWGWLDGKRAERLRCIDALDGVHTPPMRLTRGWLQDRLRPE